MRTKRLALVAAVLASLVPVAARAEVVTVEGSVPIAAVCAGRPGKDVPRERLAEQILRALNVTATDLAGAHPQATLGQFGDLAVGVAWRPSLGDEERDISVRNLVRRVENDLGLQSDVEKPVLSVTRPAKPSGNGWLFDPNKTWILTCAAGDGAVTTIVQVEKLKQRPQFVFRGKISELPAIGDARKTAEAFKAGYKREETLKDDGSHETSKTETFDGVVGWRLTKEDAEKPIYLYGAYTLSRVRKDPQAPLAAGKAIDDDDTNAYEVGLSFTGLKIPDIGLINLRGDAQIARVADDIKGSRRLKIAGAIDFGVTDQPLAICGWNTLQPIGKSRFRTRCQLRGELEASHVYDAGKADFKEHGEFVGLGGEFKFDVATPIGDKDGIIGSLAYRYLPTISGQAPDLKRFDATLKYRFWMDSGLGVDLGLTYGKGRESKSYKKEDKLEAGLGVVF